MTSTGFSKAPIAVLAPDPNEPGEPNRPGGRRLIPWGDRRRTNSLLESDRSIISTAERRQPGVRRSLRFTHV